MTILKQKKPIILKDSELWQFSLTFYSEASNRAAFLFLQDHYDLNINVMLGLLWYAASGRGACTVKQIANLHNILIPWQSMVTKELRNLRQQINKSETNLYEAIFATEIFSEKIQQCIICDFFNAPTKLVNNPSKKAKQGALNLQTYFAVCNAPLTEEGYQHTRHLLDNAFPAFKDYEFPQLSLEL